jgi:hypothetical protein
MKPNTTSLPEAQRLTYSFNPNNGWYNQTSAPPGFTKVPAELRVEPTARPEKIGASTVIRSRTVNGRYLFFTGLRETNHSNLFYGDYFYRAASGEKKNSFVLFQFKEGNTNLTIHFFNSYKVYPKRRNKFIEEYFKAVKMG